MPSLSGVASAIKAKKDKIYGSGKLEKARIIIYKKVGTSYKVDEKVNVQFNPSEYSIQRGMQLSSKKPLGMDSTPEDVNAVHGKSSVLSLTLYFDSYTELQSELGLASFTSAKIAGAIKGKYNEMAPKSLPSFDLNEESSPDADYKVNKLCDTFLSLVKYAHEEHEPPKVGFVWGEHLHFVGKVSSYTVQYTVFDRDGTPIRAKISLQIEGEDVSFTIRRNMYPKESPDRTKQRTLHYGDQLWMMAQEEYGDVERWKTIAAANGILNPRTIGGVVRLKVPSIR